jgi:hypothetical protein
MSFLDDIVVIRDGALELSHNADYSAPYYLVLVDWYRRDLPRATRFAESWVDALQRAHYWLMYVMALEANP